MTAPLHEKHPGLGCSTTLVAGETNEPECGGFYIFLPSGLTKVVAWRSMQAITPTKEAAQKYATELVDSLLKDGKLSDVERTNWASVTAAIQRIILDWNDRLKIRINEKMASEFRGMRAH